MEVNKLSLKNYVQKKVTHPVAPGYTLVDIQNYIKKKTCLEKQLSFLAYAKNDADLEKIFHQFIKMLDAGNLTLEQMCIIFVVACMLYFVADMSRYDVSRGFLIYKTFNKVDTLSPMHIHILTEKLWSSLEQKDDINFVFNIIQLSPIIASAGLTGKCIAMCLNWKIIAEITETEHKMFRFRDLKEFINMLNSLDEDSVKSLDSIKVVYILANAIGFLIATAICGENLELCEFGYQNYFLHNLMLLKGLKQICLHLYDTVADTSTMVKEENSLYTLIKQILQVRAILPLEAKITKLQTTKY